MNEQLWERAQQSLDERRDPLADAELRALLLEHPDDALALAELRAVLSESERADIPLRVERRSRWIPVAAAAALALVALLGWRAVRPLGAAEDLERHPIVAASVQFGRIDSWSVVSTSETAEGTRTVRESDGRFEIETDYRTHEDALAQAVVLTTQEERWSPR